jgi:hypothetical protein
MPSNSTYLRDNCKWLWKKTIHNGCLPRYNASLRQGMAPWTWTKIEFSSSFQIFTKNHNILHIGSNVPSQNWDTLFSTSQNTSWSPPRLSSRSNLIQHLLPRHTNSFKLTAGDVCGWHNNYNLEQLPRIFNSKSSNCSKQSDHLVQNMETKPQSNKKRSKNIFLKTIPFIP